MPSNVAETVLAVQPSVINITLNGKNSTKANLTEYPTKRVETSKTTVTADSCYTSVLRRTRLRALPTVNAVDAPLYTLNRGEFEI